MLMLDVMTLVMSIFCIDVYWSMYKSDDITSGIASEYLSKVKQKEA
jgi:hypothetical protein